MAMRESMLFLLLLWQQDLVNSIRLVELRVPAHAAVGGEALLGCQYDIEDDVLYSVKWYKDNREFYRYVPSSRNPLVNFRTPGVIVDESRSSSEVVTLIHLSRDSAGVYRCEVSGEAPLFRSVAQEKYIAIHVLPKNGPDVTGLQDQYQFKDQVNANCSTSSKPKAHLKWFINNKVAPVTYLTGPFVRAGEDDTIETSLKLTFTVEPFHFEDGVMELKCQAIVAPLYQRETEGKYQREVVHRFPDLNYNPEELPTPPAPDNDDASLTETCLILMLLAVLATVIL